MPNLDQPHTFCEWGGSSTSTNMASKYNYIQRPTLVLSQQAMLDDGWLEGIYTAWTPKKKEKKMSFRVDSLHINHHMPHVHMARFSEIASWIKIFTTRTVKASGLWYQGPPTATEAATSMALPRAVMRKCWTGSMAWEKRWYFWGDRSLAWMPKSDEGQWSLGIFLSNQTKNARYMQASTNISLR